MAAQYVITEADIISTKSDGNCFFYAILSSIISQFPNQIIMGIYARNYTNITLMQKLKEFVRENEVSIRVEYDTLIDDSTGETIGDKIISCILTDLVWAEEYVFPFIAKLFNIRIRIYRKILDPVDIFASMSSLGGIYTISPRIYGINGPLIAIEYNGGTHYQGLRRDPAVLQQSQQLQQLRLQPQQLQPQQLQPPRLQPQLSSPPPQSFCEGLVNMFTRTSITSINLDFINKENALDEINKKLDIRRQPLVEFYDYLTKVKHMDSIKETDIIELYKHSITYTLLQLEHAKWEQKYRKYKQKYLLLRRNISNN